MPKLHVAKVNDCISSIALEHGFLPDTIWNDPDNADLKRVRRDPNVLRTGDLVVIPDKQRKDVEKPTDQRHRFRRKGFPTTIHIQLLKNDEPRANEPYQLVVDGRIHDGTTDGEGRLWIHISPDARKATLFVGEGEERDEYELAVRHLQPVAELKGAQQRLHNLGYRPGAQDGEPNPQTVEALERFQRDCGLPVSGENDAATQQKLLQLHGS